MSISIPIISEIIGLGRTWLKGKTEIKKANDEAKAKIILKSADNLADWEEIQAKNSGFSWKDEYFSIILSIPLIGSFIPHMAPIITDGFTALDTTPEWYRWLVGVAICASFGIKRIDNFIAKK